MKKSTTLVLGILFAINTIVAALNISQIPALIIIVVISAPVTITCLIYWWCAGTKDGDIPFVGY
ncbi:MAG: hypothetical protein LBH02_02625 [Methanocalculaceae archaeon]|jgi:hypothetical protein|nr:hypothetical protein [Methanocalculaceae archaeon]